MLNVMDVNGEGVNLEIFEHTGQFVVIVPLECTKVNVEIIVNEIGEVREIAVIVRGVTRHPRRRYLNITQWAHLD